MKYEITKEQLQELAKGNAKVERWFPEAFKTKWDIGKWYKSKNYEKVLFFLESISNGGVNGYGLNYVGDWVNSKENFANVKDFQSVYLATESEVLEALKKEAVKIGFFEGVYIKADWIMTGNNISKSPISKGKFRLDNNGDFDYSPINGTTYTLFRKGKWAIPIKEKTLSKSEAEAKINELTNDGYAYKIG